MGTNFYLLNKGQHLHSINSMDPDYHLGKRSAAGLYCWDCKTTLCKNGEARIHYSDSDKSWYPVCPICGKEPRKNQINDGAMGRELGFNKKPFGPKTGVDSCASFTWARLLNEIDERDVKDGKKRIVDEYHKKYSLKQFRAMLTECPIVYMELLGKEFS